MFFAKNIRFYEASLDAGISVGQNYISIKRVKDCLNLAM